MISGPISKAGVNALKGELPGAVYYGIKGDPGKSAYQYAKEGGYTGTEDEFKEMLANVDLTGYATETFVTEKIAEAELGSGGHVVQETAPEDTSVLWVDPSDNNDDGFQEAVNTVLAQAKASGKFDGKTPENGVDYNTPEEKKEMVNAVLSALPTWNGGSY